MKQKDKRVANYEARGLTKWKLFTNVSGGGKIGAISASAQVKGGERKDGVVG